MPFLSVIIPLYNKESYIKNTLRSVLEQNFTDFEIIIVNDGSTDNSLEIVSSFKDERIQVIHQPNSGASSSRNKAIQSAKTEYIAFLDADDFWFPNHLEELVQLIQDFPNCGMYCSRYQTIISKNQLYSQKAKPRFNNHKMISCYKLTDDVCQLSRDL